MLRTLKLCLLALLLSMPLLAAREKAADILILSTHTESSEWEQTMLRPIWSLAKERPELDIDIFRFQLLSHPSVAALEHARDSVLETHPLPPRLVILLGGSCFNFAQDVQKRWNGVPMLLVGEQDYYCDIEYTLMGPGNPLARRHSITLLKNHGANISLISAPAMVRRTVEMICQVQPELNKILFIAGENYMCKERQWRLEKYLQERHPEIAYRVISSSNTTMDQLLSILQKESGPNTAVYYGSWLVRDGYLETVSTRHNVVSLIESIAPLYTMFSTNTEKHPNVVGFYSYSQTEYERTLQQRITDVLDHDIQPADMPFVYLEAGVPTLNYHAMEHFGLDTRLIPSDAVVIGAPKTLWQTHRRQIMLTTFIVLVLLTLFIIVIMSRSMISLRKARNLAENANNMKTAFIQNMSHEVRTPLNSIIGFSQLLCLPEGTVTQEEKEEYLSFIMNNSQLLTVMVNDMLDLSDMENGHYAIHNTPTNLNEIARQAIKAVEYRIPPGVQIVRVPGLDEDARYITDGMRVEQILINFLTNACKYTTSGEIVFGSSLVENPGYITFYVADTGPGVPAEKAESIFDRFVKLDSNIQGAGLGLSICRMVAKNLDGKVWLDTEYTQGARFILTIPKVEA